MKRLGRTGLIVAIAFAFASGAVANAYTASGGAHVRSVVGVIGDSNVALGSSAIALLWTNRDNGYLPALLTRPGAGIRTPDCEKWGQNAVEHCPTTDYWKIKLPEAWAKVDPDFVVVNLGINDTGRLGTSTTLGYADYDKKIDWFMALMPANTPVLWTNLPCAIEPPKRLTGCLVVNRALDDAQRRWRNLTVIDWAGLANDNPEYMLEDDIHLSNGGRGAWATVTRNALDART